MAHRGIAALIFGVLVLAVSLAGLVVAAPTATTTVADPLEQASVSPTPCAAAGEDAISPQSEDPIIAPRQAR
jgi:hypothetical protein